MGEMTSSRLQADGAQASACQIGTWFLPPMMGTRVRYAPIGMRADEDCI
jgi:hypothetical protein